MRRFFVNFSLPNTIPFSFDTDEHSLNSQIWAEPLPFQDLAFSLLVQEGLQNYHQL